MWSLLQPKLLNDISSNLKSGNLNGAIDELFLDVAKEDFRKDQRVSDKKKAIYAKAVNTINTWITKSEKPSKKQSKQVIPEVPDNSGVLMFKLLQKISTESVSSDEVKELLSAAEHEQLFINQYRVAKYLFKTTIPAQLKLAESLKTQLEDKQLDIESTRANKAKELIKEICTSVAKYLDMYDTYTDNYFNTSDTYRYNTVDDKKQHMQAASMLYTLYPNDEAIKQMLKSAIWHSNQALDYTLLEKIRKVNSEELNSLMASSPTNYDNIYSALEYLENKYSSAYDSQFFVPGHELDNIDKKSLIAWAEEEINKNNTTNATDIPTKLYDKLNMLKSSYKLELTINDAVKKAILNYNFASKVEKFRYAPIKPTAIQFENLLSWVTDLDEKDTTLFFEETKDHPFAEWIKNNLNYNILANDKYSVKMLSNILSDNDLLIQELKLKCGLNLNDAYVFLIVHEKIEDQSIDESKILNLLQLLNDSASIHLTEAAKESLADWYKKIQDNQFDSNILTSTKIMALLDRVVSKFDLVAKNVEQNVNSGAMLFSRSGSEEEHKQDENINSSGNKVETPNRKRPNPGASQP